jgi:hypothetical protein
VGLGTAVTRFSAKADRIASSSMQRLTALQALPANGISCGLVTSLSTIERFAWKFPTERGAKVTEILHEAPDARLVAWLPWHRAAIEYGPELII